MHKAASSAPEASRCDRGADVSSIIRGTMRILLDIPADRAHTLDAGGMGAAPPCRKETDLDYLCIVLATLTEIDAIALFVKVHPIDNHCNIVI
jgi:hypothetical protein